MLGLIPPTDTNPYLAPHPKSEVEILPASKLSTSLEKPPQLHNTDNLLPPDKTKLLYHVNKIIGVYYLCIPLSVALDILAIAHGEEHPSFSCCYKIIIRSWFIRGLTKLFRTFIYLYSQCLALQTR